MRNLVCMMLLGIAISCGEKHPAPAPDFTEEEKPTYDTTAVDSFSPGATSVDVAAQIRRASRQYQDSLLAAATAAQAKIKTAQEKARIEADLKKETEKSQKSQKVPTGNEKAKETPKSHQEETKPAQNL